MKVYHSDRFLYELPSSHRFPIEKYGLVRDQLLHEGIIAPEEVLAPELCPESYILRVHDPDYWERLKTFTLGEREQRRIGLPLHEASLKRAIASAFGTLSASLDALEEGLAFNLGGGTHHAFYDRGEAYSMVNDLAIAARHLLEKEKAERILILDLDVHQGNGTASLMESEERVFTFSMHGEKNYPFRKARSDRDIAWGQGTGDEVYLERLTQESGSLFDEVKPELVLYQAGVDVLSTDRLGTLGMSKNGCRERDRLVFQACREHGVPIAVTMGGGYSERVADVVDAHTATFREGVRIWE